MNSLANSVTRLKWSAVAFALLWTGWMIWWSGDYVRPTNSPVVRRCS
jgi:hypothetical protein